MAFVTHPMLGFAGLLEYMLEDLGIAKPVEASLAQRLFALQSFLIERQRAGQNTVLILDEAHDLDPQTLEQIRLLSNFETKSEKTLQILLVGQPELRTRLDLPELRQLKQRIGLRCRIPPLKPEQVRDYVRTRLRVAGAHDLGLFSQEADRADRRVHRRDPAPGEHGLRPLSPVRLRRPGPPHQPRHRRGGHQLPGRRRATAADVGKMAHDTHSMGRIGGIHGSSRTRCPLRDAFKHGLAAHQPLALSLSDLARSARASAAAVEQVLPRRSSRPNGTGPSARGDLAGAAPLRAAPRRNPPEITARRDSPRQAPDVHRRH